MFAMNPFKLSKLEPSLQIQLLIATFFRLHHALSSSNFSFSLVVNAEEPESDSPWLENMGILQQLKFQVDYFRTTYSGEPISNLAKSIESAIEACKEEKTGWIENLVEVTAAFITSYEPDANLHFFLLRHQEECKKIFGHIFLLNLFKKKHEGLKETEHFLIDKYQKRGFSNLKGPIRKHLASLAEC